MTNSTSQKATTVQVGGFLKRRKSGYVSVRYLVARHPFSPNRLFYREFLADGACYEGCAGLPSLKRWGEVITREQAQQLIPEFEHYNKSHPWKLDDDQVKLLTNPDALDLPRNVDEGLKWWTKLIAMNVRNAMEDFHVHHLSDAQMKELNPIIRNAIYRTLRHLWLLNKGNAKQRWLAVQNLHYLTMMIPKYWEEPAISQEELDEEEAAVSKSFDPNFAVRGFEDSLHDFEEFVKKHLRLFS